jgi:hypothetical protein
MTHARVYACARGCRFVPVKDKDAFISHDTARTRASTFDLPDDSDRAAGDSASAYEPPAMHMSAPLLPAPVASAGAAHHVTSVELLERRPTVRRP